MVLSRVLDHRWLLQAGASCSFGSSRAGTLRVITEKGLHTAGNCADVYVYSESEAGRGQEGRASAATGWRFQGAEPQQVQTRLLHSEGR